MPVLTPGAALQATTATAAAANVQPQVDKLLAQLDGYATAAAARGEYSTELHLRGDLEQAAVDQFLTDVAADGILTCIVLAGPDPAEPGSKLLISWGPPA